MSTKEKEIKDDLFFEVLLKDSLETLTIDKRFEIPI